MINGDRVATPHPQVIVIYNPCAGQAKTLRPAIERAIGLWQSQGWIVAVEPTQSAGDATRIAREAAARGVEIVVAAGGDGTVNEVMNGLVSTNAALGVLPAGTVNIWAREMGLPMSIELAAADLLQAQWCQIDVGRARSIAPRLRSASRLSLKQRQDPQIDRYFLLMAGVGFDAAVTAGVNLQEKKYLGPIAYIKQAIQMAYNYQGSRVTVHLDGKRVRGRILMAVVGNSQLYGGVVKFTVNALLNDGLLDVCIVKGRSMLEAPRRLLSIFTRSHHLDDRIEYYRARQIQFRSRKPVPIQLDGDYLGTQPIRFEVVPKSLWALIPPNADPSLWGKV
jgi:YegS/Rv2252/BmrU family lipid kinase